jgi:hypothetical protein
VPLGWAWLALTLALAAHVADEAANDFLSFYNPTVEAFRERHPALALPTFTFSAWLARLCVALAALLALSVPAFRGSRWIAYLAWPYGILMLGNGALHLVGSLWIERPLPGVWSAPLLLLASFLLLASARRELSSPSGGG